jgi:hypothetical protein
MENEFEDSLDELLDHYNSTHEKKGSGVIPREELMKKFFVPQNATEEFRVVKQPSKDGDKLSYTETAHFHEIKVGEKYRKAYCFKHNDDTRCPMCEMEGFLLGKQLKKKFADMTPEEKEKNDKIYKLSLKFKAKKFYIIKGLDRGQEKDGVKFWRFKHNYKMQGVYDKLVAAVKFSKQENNIIYTDVLNGVDLQINVADDKMPNGKKFKTVTSIMAKSKTSPLSLDDAKQKAWSTDTLKWTDVFKPLKAPHVDEIKFLELAAKGVAPFYDEKVKRWYAPENPDLEAKMNERTQNLEAKEEESSFGGDNEFEDEISQLMNDKKAASKTADIESMPTSQVATKKASTKEAVKETVKTLDDNDGLGFDDDDLPF